jgi:hypothetical protein
MRFALLLLTAAAFLGSCIWAYNVRDYEPYLAVVTSAAGFIGLWISGDADKLSMSQRGGRKSTNYQAAGDMYVGVKNKENKQDE